MKKVPFIIAIFALFISIGSFFYFQSSSELVYVDVNKLLDGYARTKVEKSKFQEKASALQANVDSLIVDWQDELKSFEKERQAMTSKELELKKELLGTKQNQINSYQQAIQRQIQEADQEATQTVVNDINDYVKEYGKENNYKIIFGASGAGNIMYADNVTDLTEKVLEGLNAQYKGT